MPKQIDFTPTQEQTNLLVKAVTLDKRMTWLTPEDSPLSNNELYLT
jgi:hypothetical protein